MTLPPRFLVAMIGARRQYAIPRALAQNGWLELFVTDRASAKKCDLFSPSNTHQPRVRQLRLFALYRLLLSRLARTTAMRYRAYARWNRWFASQVCRLPWHNVNGVYVFNAAGREILLKAKELGMIRVVDQTTLPWAAEQAIVEEERAQWPGWECGDVTREDWQELADREQEEWNLAHLVICGSENVLSSLLQMGVPPSRCAVIPYGLAFSPELSTPRNIRSSGPLRVLFVGTLELRKGIPYLWQAASALPMHIAEFRLVGPIRLTSKAVQQMSGRLHVVGPASRHSVRRHYEWADVLVLPTLSEGSANVCYEALAYGLPVITTPAAGSIVRDGIEGFIVPVRNSNALAEKISQLAADRALLQRMSDAALRRIQAFSLSEYARKLADAIMPLYIQSTS